MMGLGITDEPIADAFLYNTSAVVIHVDLRLGNIRRTADLRLVGKIDRSLVEAATDLDDGPDPPFPRLTLGLSLHRIISATAYCDDPDCWRFS